MVELKCTLSGRDMGLRDEAMAPPNHFSRCPIPTRRLPNFGQLSTKSRGGILFICWRGFGLGRAERELEREFAANCRN
jgi:hypothetical protein